MAGHRRAAASGSVWSAGVGANASESECRGAYANGSDMVGEGVGKLYTSVKA